MHPRLKLLITGLMGTVADAVLASGGRARHPARPFAVPDVIAEQKIEGPFPCFSHCLGIGLYFKPFADQG